MNRTSSIKQICHDRGIKILVHFTHIENLRRILGEGLLSRETLETMRNPLKKPLRFNDQDRLDKHPEAICLSISFPNYKMFFKYASEKQSQWVVLLLDAKLLWELDCAFCQENAASNAVHTIPLKERKKPDALNNMFIDYDSISRQSLSIPDHYPTYPQAEVLVCNPIPVAYIKKVHFYEKPALEQWYSQNSGMDTETFVVSKQYFHPRYDWKVWTEEAERQRQERAAEKARLAVEEAERQRQEELAEEVKKYPLHNAAKNNAQETVEVLLNKGVDVNAKNVYDNTPLHYAVRENAQETVKALLNKGADVNAKNVYGDTPLHDAAWNNTREAVEVLLNQGAHVNAKNKDGETPLHFARSNNALEVAKILQRYGGY